MASDLKVDIDGIRLNIRVGTVLKFKDEVLIEISTVGRNSVIPGGRIQINESSCKAVVREVYEEMHFKINEQKLQMLKVLENFFTSEQKQFHEIYFLYEYVLDEEEYKSLQKIENNFDNSTTYFKFVNKMDLKKYNVMPLEIYDTIQK